MSQVPDKILATKEATEPKGPTPLWRNRDFMLLGSGPLVSSVGSRVSLLAFPLLILAITHSPPQPGLIAPLRGIPYALFVLPTRALIDPWHPMPASILSVRAPPPP